MRKIYYCFLLIIFFHLLAISGFGQQYLGWTIEKAVVRWEPTSSARVVTTLEPGRQIFIDSLVTKNDYSYIIDIGTNNEGYVHKDLVLAGQPVEVPEGDVFTITGEGPARNPQVEIQNQTSKSIVFKLNNNRYVLQPAEKRKISVEPGRYKCLVSAPGIIPYVGFDDLKENLSYKWAFYARY